ncbi:MAG: TonB family protein [Planctomycetia bacterium]|nr:TonB family protein [Planctomycetia bacterium]
MKLFLTALFLALSIHGLLFGALVLIGLSHVLSYSPPVVLLAYGDSSVEGFDVDAVSLEPGTERYGTRMTPGGAEPATVATPTPAAEPLPAALEAAPNTEALPAETPVETEPVPPPAVVAEAPPTQTALAAAVVQAALIRPNSVTGPAGGAPLPQGTPSRGGTVGSRTGVRMVGLARPVYPREAVLRGLEGRVVLFLRISAEGTVTEVKLNESSGYPVLDEAALAFGRTLQFIPAREGSQAVSATALYPVRYQLTENR